MDITINSKYIIEDLELLADNLAYFTKLDIIDSDKIINFIETAENTIFFVDEKLSMKTEMDGAKYAWLDTGLVNESGDPVFISLIRDYNEYVGKFVGSVKTLAKRMIDFNPQYTRFIRDNISSFNAKYEKRIAKRDIKHFERIEMEMEEIEEQPVYESHIGSMIKNLNLDLPKDLPETSVKEKEVIITKELTAVTEEMFGQLLFPSWSSIEGLDRYLKIIGRRLSQLIEQGKDDYYEFNKLKHAIVNTGIMNQFGADYLVIYRMNITHNNYEAYKIINGKTDWIENGYTKEQTCKNIKPIYFLDENQVFAPDMDEFDINYHNMLHIIEERRERFPENMQTISAVTIATKLQNALERGVRMQQRDRSYAKPIYSAKTGTVSWLMPFHINTEFTDEPELVLVVRRAGEFYEVKTVLPYDKEVQDRITALSLYSRLW